MSKSLNRITLLGNVGQDPEIRSTQNGVRVATFSLATSESWKDGSGRMHEDVQWHRIVVWNRTPGVGGLVGIVERYVRKGTKLLVEGKVMYRKWEDKDGIVRYSTDVTVKDMYLLGSSEKSGNTGNHDHNYTASHQRRPAAAHANAEGPAQGSGEFDDFPGALQDEDDDLPF